MLLRRREPVVTKECDEVSAEEDDKPPRLLSYGFDFGNSERWYHAYIYRERPYRAYVDLLGWNDPPVTRWWRRASHDPYLRAIHRHLCADAGRPVDVYIKRRGLRRALIHRGWERKQVA